MYNMGKSVETGSLIHSYLELKGWEDWVVMAKGDRLSEGWYSYLYGRWRWMHNSVNKLTVIRWVVVWYTNNLSIKLFYKTELTEWIHGPFVEFPTKVLFYHRSVEARMLKWILHIAWISLSFILSFFLPPYPPSPPSPPVCFTLVYLFMMKCWRAPCVSELWSPDFL